MQSILRAPILVLILSCILTACGEPPPPHAPATSTDDAGYLVESALTFTPGIPSPWRCYNGFNPFMSNGAAGMCDFQPNQLAYNAGYPYDVRPCTGNPPHGYVEITDNNGYPGANCARVPVTFFSGHWGAYQLVQNGWDINFAGDPGGPAAPKNTKIVRILLGPGTKAWVTDAVSLHFDAADPCDWIDPDSELCFALPNTTPYPALYILDYAHLGAHLWVNAIQVKNL